MQNAVFVHDLLCLHLVVLVGSVIVGLVISDHVIGEIAGLTPGGLSLSNTLFLTPLMLVVVSAIQQIGLCLLDDIEVAAVYDEDLVEV